MKNEIRPEMNPCRIKYNDRNGNTCDVYGFVEELTNHIEVTPFDNGMSYVLNKSQIIGNIKPIKLKKNGSK